MDPNRFRDDFPILKRLIRGKPLVYLDNAATTQKPRAVLQAMADFYENHNANIHRGVHTLSDEATQLYDEARAKTAAFIGAPKPESVIFTRNATEAINLVAYAWGRKFLSGGDEILLTEMEHHSNLVPWQILCQEKGVRLRFIPVTPEGTLDLQAAAKVITPKTKLVSFTACSNALGTINPVSELVALARSVGAKCLIDASQWTPHFPTDVVKWDCDFLVFSGHKMLGHKRRDAAPPDNWSPRYYPGIREADGWRRPRRTIPGLASLFRYPLACGRPGHYIPPRASERAETAGSGARRVQAKGVKSETTKSLGAPFGGWISRIRRRRIPAGRAGHKLRQLHRAVRPGCLGLLLYL